MRINGNLPKKIFGVKLKDKHKLCESQSGGAFTGIAEYFIRQGAIVYGCGLDDNQRAIYYRVTSIEQLNKLKKSKYVQAELGHTLVSVKEDLELGKIVLFSGTPCYVAAVKNFVEKCNNKHNLYTIDIICHGVPSPLVYNEYIAALSEKRNKKVNKFIFRN